MDLKLGMLLTCLDQYLCNTQEDEWSKSQAGNRVHDMLSVKSAHTKYLKAGKLN